MDAKVLIVIFITANSILLAINGDSSKQGQPKENLQFLPKYGVPAPIDFLGPRPDPCLPYNPPKPDFNIEGRRINEAKCLEYKWMKEVQNTIKLNEVLCAISKLRRKRDWRPDNEGDDKIPPAGAVGGRDTLTGEFPHMGAIGWKLLDGTWLFQCGSSLISPNFVLTAGHCTAASSLDTRLADVVPKIVRFGMKNILEFHKNSQPIDVNIKNIIKHPDYRPPKKYYDIALMELERDVQFSEVIHPVCLWNHFDTSSLGTRATLTGWGATASGAHTNSPELQAAEVDVLESATCNKLLKSANNRNWSGMRDHQLCAGKLEGGVDSCSGDSGGPLQMIDSLGSPSVFSYYVIGVTSFGIKCAYPNLPGIYTRVSSFVDWIEPIVWPQ